MNEWDAILLANSGYAPHDRVIKLGQSPATLYGTVPASEGFTMRQMVHLGLPRDLSNIDPRVVALLKPHMVQVS